MTIPPLGRAGRSGHLPLHGCPRAAAGFTLVELLIALAIGAILLLLALPSYRAWIADVEVRHHVQALVE
ncbi:MAG: prepilin-type N-terminal cleavage/methylation domain-containing protein, partial [Casimicrobiaceae bacterium]